MTSAAQQQARVNAELGQGAADLRKGTCISIDWSTGLATVNVPGSTIELPMVGVTPIVNARCLVGRLGGTLAVLGPEPRPPHATVTGSPAGGIVTVMCDDDVSRDVAYGGDPAALVGGTRVTILWTDRGGEIVLLPLGDPATGDPIARPTDIPSGGPQSRVFNPYTSATWADGVYGSGWKGGELWDSDHNRGAWFYQGIADTIPDNATGGRMTLHVPGGNGFGGNPSIGAHALGGPSGNLSITGRKPIPSGGGDIDISEFFDAFKTGALLGIGTGGGGNWRIPGAGQYNSGAISATWRT